MNFGIVVAAGKSERMGPDIDKAFLSLGTRPVVAYSLMAFEKCPDVDSVVLVVRKDKLEAARAMVQMFGCAKVKRVVAGGIRRQDSVLNGLEHVPLDAKIVVVHDGARPCVTSELITEVVNSAKRFGSGVAACKITDTIKEIGRGLTIAKTVDRTKLWAVQTPQAFRRDLLAKAFEVVKRKRMVVTDESSAVELVCDDVRLVAAPWTNIKITTPNDLVTARRLLNL